MESCVPAGLFAQSQDRFSFSCELFVLWAAARLRLRWVWLSVTSSFLSAETMRVSGGLHARLQPALNPIKRSHAAQGWMGACTCLLCSSARIIFNVLIKERFMQMRGIHFLSLGGRFSRCSGRVPVHKKQNNKTEDVQSS